MLSQVCGQSLKCSEVYAEQPQEICYQRKKEILKLILDVLSEVC